MVMKISKRGRVVHVLTPDDVEMYWAAIDRWQTKLGLGDWRITRRAVDKGAFMAQMDSWDYPQRQVRATLCTNWKDSEPTPLEIERTAVHELLHVRLADLTGMLLDGDTVTRLEHAAINVLEALLLPTPQENP
jgi:hypothetical protein